MDETLLYLVNEVKVSGQQKEAIRKLLELPRYTPEQIVSLARKDVIVYLTTLEQATLTDLIVDEIKNIIRQPIESEEDTEDLGQQISNVFEIFFEDELNLEDLNPIYKYRWYLALMTENQYISMVNTLNHIYTQFIKNRTIWVHQQVSAIQIEIQSDIEEEQAFEEALKEHVITSPEVAEA